MPEEWKRLLLEKLAQWGIPVAIIMGAILVKWLHTRSARTVGDWFRSVSVSIFAGGVLNLYLTDIPAQDMGPGAKGAVLALVVLVADHLLTGIFKVGAEFARDPHEFMVNWSSTLRMIWRGRK